MGIGVGAGAESAILTSPSASVLECSSLALPFAENRGSSLETMLSVADSTFTATGSTFTSTDSAFTAIGSDLPGVGGGLRLRLWRRGLTSASGRRGDVGSF